MPEQIYIGNFPKGQITDRLPFAIDNNSFPTLFNMYVWRGRAKRKRGTITLGQLAIQTTLSSTLVAGDINLLVGLPATSTIVPGSITLVVGANTYTEPSPPDGTLVGIPAGSGTINYATGAVTIASGAGSAITGSFSYFPGNPVMGLRDFINQSESLYPLLMAFDTTNAYQVNQAASPFFYNVTYYKGTQVPFVWSGQDYQQFWTTNYQGALWATNGNPGFNFVTATYTSGSPGTAITFTLTTGAGAFKTLVIGDKLWFNEFTGGSTTINGITGVVTSIAGAATGVYVVTFNSSQTIGAADVGIAQLLTNTIPGQDGIKWYDGDPTSGNGIPGATGLGWMNFAPPLTALTVQIENSPLDKWYLIGALIIVPYKDRLLFCNPTIGNSKGAVIALQDVILWSSNGPAYYAVYDTSNTTLGATVFTSLVPSNQSSGANQSALYFNVKQKPGATYFVDQTGLGGYLAAGISQPITTVTTNEDVLLVGFAGPRGKKTRFVYTGNDLNPFLFFSINSELPSDCTFSAITLDKGAIDIGNYGIAMTDQQSCARIDLDIPDSVFQISNLSNGNQRVNAVRDFQKEWIYFAYPTNSSDWKYPTQSFLYNYRDNTWAILYENFTAHGTFRYVKSFTWATLPYNNWDEWVDPWNSGIQSAQFPNIVGGTPEGYVLIKGEGTAEGPSCTIYAIATANAGSATQITAYNHCVTASNQILQSGDFIYITGMIGTALSYNGKIGKVIKVIDKDNFVVDLAFDSGTYLGLGAFAKLSQPFLQTKQFNPYWEQGRQVRLSAQKYLMDYTLNAQVTVNINLSQDPDTVWNAGPIVPATNATNRSLVYSQLMYTCQESTNLGLSPANTNLQMPTAATQYQIWHRFNTSLIGDSVQIGITLSTQETAPGLKDAQMYSLDFATSEVTLHGIHLTVERSSHLA